MSPNDDGATKSNEIGDALVTALGFEPTDSESLRQAEISEQMSDGFTVTDVLDRDGDDSDDSDEAANELDSVDADELDDLDDESVDDVEDDFVAFDDDADAEDDDVDDLDELNAEDLDESDVDSDDDLLDDVAAEDASADLLDDAADELDDPDLASDVGDDADDKISAVDESDDDSLGTGYIEKDSDKSTSQPLTADSDDADSVIDAVVDSPEKNAGSSNGATSSSDSTGIFGSRRGGFGRSGSDEDELMVAAADSSDGVVSGDEISRAQLADDEVTSGMPTGAVSGKKVYAETAFPGVESDPDVTLMPGSDSPAITGEHDVVQVDDSSTDEPAVVQTREAVEGRGLVETVPSLGSLTGWRPGGRRLQARKVRRVIRHIDPWSVLTFSVLFFLCLFAALLLASVLVWNVAEEAGTIENVENFILELGDYERFEINGEDIFRAAVAIMGVFTLAASVIVVLLTVMFNLLSDLLGGIRITVIEEETIRVRPRRQLATPKDTELLE